MDVRDTVTVVFLVAGLAFMLVGVLGIVRLPDAYHRLHASSKCTTLGLMGLLGVSFNLANFFAAPILVGLGIDGSLHMVHRWREGGPDRLHFGGTRRAVVLTATTTMIGFGCLLIAEHQGLRTLGIVMALGSAACMMAVIVLLPSLLALRDRWNASHRRARRG